MTAEPETQAIYTVKLFGIQAERVGRRTLDLTASADGLTARALLHQLGQQHPALGDSLSGSRLAVDHEFVEPSTVIHPGPEIALIGLVGGG
jgi:molybdopterin converting factor small subunit